MSKKFDDDKRGTLNLQDNPYWKLERAQVLQEARVFNEYPVNPKKCRVVLTKILVLLTTGPFQRAEATALFFSITRLFQCPDTSLRQMVYLAVKELAMSADDVMMATASITKDMNAKSDLVYRPNAIRALAKITDASMMQGIERFIKQSIVDRNPSVASAALVSSIHLYALNRDVVKRWANEVQEAINSKGYSAQYHALGLLYSMRNHDKMAVIKMVQNFARGSLRSPHAVCMLIRYAWKVMEDETGTHSLYEQLENWLRHKNDMVVYEAARAICNLKDVSQKELFPAVSALQLLLVSHKPTLRFAAIRTLNQLAMTHPEAVSPCNLDLENLVTDPNRSISTFAITTLLKTGNEQSVDRLMKQITSFMADISDDFKIIVVDAIRCLCLKFPSKHISMLNFLKDILRDEGGYDFKKAIVEAIFDIVYAIPESKELALEHLCEFIEDCDYAQLSVRILHLLGVEGPKTAHPTKYIRYIYNRVILENSVVRAAAVSSLAKFAEHLDDARERIKILLERCTDDNDDEVRDRAVMYLRIINNHELSRKYIANDSTYAWATLESNLLRYIKDPTEYAKPFNMTNIPVVSSAQEKLEIQKQKDAKSELSAVNTPAKVETTSVAAEATSYASIMSQIPQLAQLGPVFKSSIPAQISESEEEYVITCIKHIFERNVVFQFECRNTLNESILENVTVMMNVEENTDPEDALLIPKVCIPLEKLSYNEPGSIYAVYERPAPNKFPTAKYAPTLKFQVRDCDPDTGVVDDVSYPDEYQPESFDVFIGDYMLPTYIPSADKVWEELPHLATETFALGEITTVKDAVATLEKQLGMKTLTDNIKESTRLEVSLGGTFLGGFPCLAKVKMVIHPTNGLTMQLNIKSPIQDLSDRIANSIQ